MPLALGKFLSTDDEEIEMKEILAVLALSAITAGTVYAQTTTREGAKNEKVKIERDAKQNPSNTAPVPVKSTALTSGDKIVPNKPNKPQHKIHLTAPTKPAVPTDAAAIKIKAK
jgi:hypothetical protein